MPNVLAHFKYTMQHATVRKTAPSRCSYVTCVYSKCITSLAKVHSVNLTSVTNEASTNILLLPFKPIVKLDSASLPAPAATSYEWH